MEHIFFGRALIYVVLTTDSRPNAMFVSSACFLQGMMSVVSQIAYLSLAKTLSGEAPLSDVLSVSKMNNTRDGITGILMYHDRLFFQILEGERSIVDRCYNRILCDPRHSAISLMWKGEAENRTFSDWAMGYAGPNKIDLNSEHELVSLTDVAGGKDALMNSDCLALQMSLQMFQMFRRVKYPFS